MPPLPARTNFNKINHFREKARGEILVALGWQSAVSRVGTLKVTVRSGEQSPLQPAVWFRDRPGSPFQPQFLKWTGNFVPQPTPGVRPPPQL
jgi:hypothetical protein